MLLADIAGSGLLGVSVLMMIDAVLAFVLGKRYLCWMLEYLPEWYARFVMRLSDRPALLRLFVLAEFAAGIFLFWAARMLLLTYNPL